MEPQLTLAPWEVADSQEDVRVGPVNAVHRLHLEGETRPVHIRFVPDVRGQFLMFLKREDDEREGCWAVIDRHRIEAKRFKAPYLSHLQIASQVLGEALGRVFHFENLDARFDYKQFQGVWRVCIGVDGVGSWTNLHHPALGFGDGQWSGWQEFVFRIGFPSRTWFKQSASQWLEAFENELQQADSNPRFALNFACASRPQQEDARLCLERGTTRQLRAVLKWLVQTHQSFWGNTNAWLWEVSPTGGGDFSYSGGGSGEDEIWEFINRPAILGKWGEFVFGKMAVSLDEARQERHPCLQAKFCHFHDSIFELRVEAPTQHEKMEAFLGIKEWVEEFAPEDGAWLLPS